MSVTPIATPCGFFHSLLHGGRRDDSSYWLSLTEELGLHSTSPFLPSAEELACLQRVDILKLRQCQTYYKDKLWDCGV